MKKLSLLILFLLSSFGLSPQSVELFQDNGGEQGMEILDYLQLPQDKEAVKKALEGWWTESQKNLEERMEWYNDAKFGCFIHWGPYSVQGGCNMPLKPYAKSIRITELSSTDGWRVLPI
jgi:hypothetical protein